MPKITSKSTISNSITSAEVNFLETAIGKFLFTCLAISGSPTIVEIEKGSERVL